MSTPSTPSSSGSVLHLSLVLNKGRTARGKDTQKGVGRVHSTDRGPDTPRPPSGDDRKIGGGKR